MAALTYGKLPVHGNLVTYTQAGHSGPVMVLVHGLASRAAQWEAVMSDLGEHFRVIAPDLLGHGESAKPRGDYSLGAQACSIRDLLAGLGHDRATLVGHSLGGGIAMQFAYQFPERIERLALLNAGGLGQEVSPFLRAATLPGSELVLPLIAGSWVRKAARTVDGLFGKAHVTVPEGLREALVGFGSLGDGPTRSAFVHTARSVIDIRGQRVDGRDRLFLAKDLPLLVVWGKKDAIIPVEHGQAVAAMLPHARLEVFDQSGHFPHLTEPARLAAVLSDWMRQTKPAQLGPEFPPAPPA